jgi:tetratricopeptide (TPR) repeat protein
MTCPNCRVEQQQQLRYCTSCGVIFSQHSRLKAARPKMKRGALLRVGGAISGMAVGFCATYFPLAGNPKWASEKELAGFVGAIVGAILFYSVSGIRLTLRKNRFKRELASTQKKIERQLGRALDQFKDLMKEKKIEPTVREVVGTAHLLSNDLDKSLHEYQKAREDGLTVPSVFNNAGVALVRSGRISNALELFEQAEKKAEREIAVHSNLAHAFEMALVSPKEDIVERAMVQINSSMELDGDSPTHLNRRGLVLCRAGRHLEAIEAFEKALELAGLNRMQQADAHNNLGMARFELGDAKAATHHFQMAMRLDPGHGRAMANQGVVMVESGTFSEGIELLQKAATLDQKSASVHSNLGYALCKSNAVNEGILALRKAISLDPGMFEPLYNLGKAYQDHDVEDMAARYLTRAQQINDQSWQALVTLAVVNIRLGEYTQARNNMETAMKTAPQDVDVYTVMGVALGYTFDFVEAERYLRAALAMDKESANAYGQLAWLHVQQNNVSLASEELMIALGKDDKNSRLVDNYGLTQIELGSAEGGMVSFRKALDLDPRYYSAHYHVGYVYSMKKRIDEALSEWEKSAKFEPKYADVHCNLGVLYFRKDKMDEAVSEFRATLQLRQDRMEDYSNLALAYSKQGVLLRKASKRPDDYKAKAAKEKFGQAIDMFDRSLAMTPDNVILHSNRGLACFFANRIEDAMREEAR